MGNPTISGAAGSLSVDATRFFRGELYVSWDSINAGFSIQCPQTASVTLTRVTPAIALAGGPISTTADVTLTGGEHTIAVTAVANSPALGQSTLTFAFTFTGLGSPPAAFWRIECINAAPAPAHVEDDGSQSSTLYRVLADASVTNTVIAGDVFSDEKITLGGSVNHTQVTSGGAFPGPLPALPLLWGQWTQVAPVNVAVDPSSHAGATVSGAVGPLAAGTTDFVAPLVYGPTPASFALRGYYDTYDAVANPGPTLAFTLKTGHRHIVLVVDRSGSMAGSMTGSPASRWEFAVRASHVWADLYVVFRGAVDAQDRGGIMVFENNLGSWGPATADADLAQIVPPGTALGAISALNLNPLSLGAPGSSTPIGDALVKGMRRLVGGTADEHTRFVLVLITDGYENCGQIAVDKSAALPSGASAFFDDAVSGTVALFSDVDALKAVRDKLRIVTIGLGSTVQESVLNNLAYVPAPGATTPGGMYRIIHNPLTLADSIAESFKFALSAEKLSASHAEPDEKTWYYPVTPFEHRLAFIVMGLSPSDPGDWNPATDFVEVFYRKSTDAPGTYPQHVAGSGVPGIAGVVHHERLHHGMVSIDLAQLLGADLGLATEWKIQWSRGGVPQVLPSGGGPNPQHVIAMVDLFLSCDYSFDKPEYGIGEPMQISCSIRAGADAVLDAKVEALLERPGEGLGTFLSLNGKGYVPAPPRPTHREGRNSMDPPHPKLAMRQQLLAERSLDDLPLIRPANIFVDSSNLLHDPDKRGSYANAYAATDKEGSYTFTFRASGKLPSGAIFARTLTLSKWVGVKIDPAQTRVTLQLGLSAPAGQLAARISILPRAHNGEYLGPFREGLFRIRTTAGLLEPLRAEPDGHYTQVLHYKPGEVPRVSITVGGVPLTPVVVSDNRLCCLLAHLPRTFEELLEEIECLLCHEVKPEHEQLKHGFLLELEKHLHDVAASHPLGRLVDRLKKLFGA